MFSAFLAKIVAGFTALTISIAGFLGFVPKTQVNQMEQSLNQQVEIINNLNEKVSDLENQIPLGSTYFVAGGIFYLAGSGISSSATSITLQSFIEPVSSEELSMEDFGSIGFLTLEPGNSSKKEIVSFTGVSQAAASTKATLTGVTRGLMFTYPYTASTSLAMAHSGGVQAIISNPPQFYNRFAVQDNAATITASWIIGSSTPLSYDATISSFSNTRMIPDINYVNTVATSGAAQSSTSTSGVVELGTIQEMASGTATSSVTTYLVPSGDLFASIPSGSQKIPVTGTGGTLNPNFIATSSDYTWSGTNNFSGTTTMATTTIGDAILASTTASNMVITGTTTINASTTVSKSLAVTGTTTLATTTISNLSVTATSSFASTIQLRYYEIDPTLVTSSTTNGSAGWVDWNLTAITPNAQAVEIIVYGEPNSVNDKWGVRYNGSSIDRRFGIPSNAAATILRDTITVPTNATTVLETFGDATTLTQGWYFYIAGYWK